MSDWRVGDLALCIKSGKITRTGKIYTVSDMHIKEPGSKANSRGIIRTLKESELWLKFIELNHAPKQWANSNRFIKVTPEDEDEFDREVINHMKKECV